MNIITLKNILKHRPMPANQDFQLRGELFSVGRLISSEWADEFKKEHYPAPTEEDSRSYERCTYCTVSLKGGKVVAELKIHDGCILDGRPEKLRCSYSFELKKVTKRLAGHASGHLRDLAIEAVAREDEEIYNLRIKAAQEKLMLG